MSNNNNNDDDDDDDDNNNNNIFGTSFRGYLHDQMGTGSTDRYWN